jgi:hypothetical protein
MHGRRRAGSSNNFEAASFVLTTAHGEDEWRGRIMALDTRAPRGVGLLIIDMINDLSFEGGEAIREEAEAAADQRGGSS